MISRRQAYSTLIISKVRHIFAKVDHCLNPPARVNKVTLSPKKTAHHLKTPRPEHNRPQMMPSVIVTEQSNNLLISAEIKRELGATEDDWKCKKLPATNEKSFDIEYMKCISDLNSLIHSLRPLTKRDRQEVLPLFAKQLSLAGLSVTDLNSLNIIHVSGTKGKGSTCAFVESILRTAGLKTGFYSSPHLVRVNERIRIGGQPIDNASFCKYFRTIYDRLLVETKAANIPMPGYFSFLTILAFQIFLDQKVGATVIEVGVGGEYDSTNVIQKPIACGISTLDYDHTNVLGNTLSEIAWSKAGIVKMGAPVFTVEQQLEAYEVIKQRCDERICPLYICKPLNSSFDLKLGIEGSAQYTNAALACQLAKSFLKTVLPNFKHATECSQACQSELVTDLSMLPSVFQKAISNCTWPGRCQMIKYPRISFFLDGAHTKKSMENCLDWFITNSKEGHADAEDILMVNIIGERDRRSILFPLSTHKGFKTILFSTNKVSEDDDRRECRVENVQDNVKVWQSLANEGKHDAAIKVLPSVSACLQFLTHLSESSPKTKYNVLATGSLHFVGAVLETLPAFKASLVKDID